MTVVCGLYDGLVDESHHAHACVCLLLWCTCDTCLTGWAPGCYQLRGLGSGQHAQNALARPFVCGTSYANAAPLALLANERSERWNLQSDSSNSDKPVMAINVDEARLDVDRIRSRDAVEELLRTLGHEAGSPPALSDSEGPSEAIAVRDSDHVLCVAGLTRGSPRLAMVGLRINTVTLAPFVVARSVRAGGPACGLVDRAIHLVLREIFFGADNWHVARLNVLPEQEAIVDASWRYAINLGYSCTLSQQPPPHRLDTGELRPRAPTLAIYSPRFKGALARAADSGLMKGLHSVLRERQEAIETSVRHRRRSPSTQGSRFFALELATVSEDDLPGQPVTFTEIPEDTVVRDPLVYGTSVQRVEESLRRGDRCFAAFVGGVIAHHKWVSVNSRFLRKVLPARALNRATAYPFDAYTYPQFRGQALQGATHRWLAIQYRGEGIEQFVVRITARNESSIRGVLKAGYTEITDE